MHTKPQRGTLHIDLIEIQTETHRKFICIFIMSHAKLELRRKTGQNMKERKFAESGNRDRVEQPGCQGWFDVRPVRHGMSICGPVREKPPDRPRRPPNQTTKQNAHGSRIFPSVHSTFINHHGGKQSLLFDTAEGAPIDWIGQ